MTSRADIFETKFKAGALLRIRRTALAISLCLLPAGALAQPIGLMGVTSDADTCFIGGSEKGLFGDASQIVPKLAINQIYTLVDLTGPLREVAALGQPVLNDAGDCDASYTVELALEEGQPGKFAVAVSGATADVEKLLPAKVTTREPDDQVRQILADYLKQAGLPAAELSFQQILSVDLDRDGQDDLIINASLIGKDEIAQGNYSVLLLKQGETIIPVHSEVVATPPEEPPSLLQNRVVAIVDVDGRGPYELVVFSFFDYGDGWDITAVVDGKARPVLWCGCGG
ncbi:hypothetical protein FHS85_000483 [Rhodoligotrophos appendicifer]|uniref:hypothetical protein n=1 Tax=Rhodoligotrophos appendicifer TaxID=987056 RepID=UPI0011803307|nr:hypothetical protein [Rhodoligotrophos appendicifer]